MSLPFTSGPQVTWDVTVNTSLTGELRIDLGASTFEIDLKHLDGQYALRLEGIVLETTPQPGPTTREAHLVIGRRRLVFRVDTTTLAVTVITAVPGITIVFTNGRLA